MPPLRFGSEGLWTGTPNALAAFQVLLYCGVVTALVAPWPRRADRGHRRSGSSWRLMLPSARPGAPGSGSRSPPSSPAIAWFADGRPRRASSGLGDGSGLADAHGSCSRRGRRLGRGRPDCHRGRPSPAHRRAATDLRTDLIAASIRMFQAAPLTGQGPGTWAPERLAYTDACARSTTTSRTRTTSRRRRLRSSGLSASSRPSSSSGSPSADRASACGEERARSADSRSRRCSPPCTSPASSSSTPGSTSRRSCSRWPCRSRAWTPRCSSADAVLKGPPRRLLSVVLLIAVLVGGGAALWPEPAAQLDLEAVAAADHDAWPEAFRKSTQAVALDPRLPPYHFVQGLSAARVGDLEARESCLLERRGR